MTVTTGTCVCGKVTIKTRTPGGIATLKCHCSHCRKVNASDPVTQGKYGLQSVDWCCNVKVSGPTKSTWTTFTPYGCPCPLWCVDRRSCEHCKQPVVAIGHGAIEGMAIVNCATIQRCLPEGKELKVRHEQFYNSGLKDEPPAKRTYYGDIGSTVGLMYELMCCSVPFYGTGHCCCIGWNDPSKQVAVAPS